MNISKEILVTVKVFFILSILLGIIYPCVMVVIGQLVVPDKANGSLVVKDGRVVGSRLIGQSFKSSQYFHGRESAVGYNGAGSGGSNLGPSSRKLMAEVRERVAVFRREEGLDPGVLVPGEMVLGSGSGLDPNISLESAILQVERIAQVRGVEKGEIMELLDTLGRGGGRINVFEANLALDSKPELNNLNKLNN